MASGEGDKGVWDVVIVGAGAAGLFCAGIAGQRGLKVLLIDHAERVAEKIRISGGGRCNFTNREVTAANFSGANPDFCRSALARYTPADFIALIQRHGIARHEKHKGQLFCDDSAEQIIAMLLAECAAGNVTRWQPCAVAEVRRAGEGFALDTDRGRVQTRQLVVATGGLSIPKIGASDFGYRLARQFGLRIIEPRPALVPLTFGAEQWAPFIPLAGVALPVEIRTGTAKSKASFNEDLLFTHRGLSGPAVLQISSFWRSGQALSIDLLPGLDLAQTLREAKVGSRRQLGNALAQWLPQRLAEAWLVAHHLPAERLMADVRDRDLASLAQSLSAWTLTPSGSEGFRKAEVTIGGVDTHELDSRDLQCKRLPGLHFIGEVVDVTGWLGGYNFQWAWASGAACGRALSLTG